MSGLCSRLLFQYARHNHRQDGSFDLLYEYPVITVLLSKLRL